MALRDTVGDAAAPGALASAWMAEAIQRIESAGPLDDAGELQHAFRHRQGRAAQFHERAWRLGERLGLPQEMARWRQVGGFVVVALAVLMALSALGIARAVLGEGRSINAMAALVSVLGLNTVMLALWLVGVGWSWLARPAGGAGSALGRLALWLTARLPLDRNPHSAQLLQAATALLRRERLLPWLTGAISHTIWALAFAMILLMLGFGFAFHAYQLTWETTILSADFFQRVVHLTGLLPSWLGFPVPDAAAVQQAGGGASSGWQQSATQRQWAWWLIGCTAAYGLLPRALLAIGSAAGWRAGVSRLGRLDEADPYVRRVFARLDALEPPPQVIDPERRAPRGEAAGRVVAAGTPGAVALIGFELPPECRWPPDDWQTPLVLCEQLDGSARQRQATLSQLAAARPESLIVACHALSSPDRGTARVLRELTAQAPRSALWLLADADARASTEQLGAAVRRWRDWLPAESLTHVALIDPDTDPANWLRTIDQPAGAGALSV